MSTSHKGESYNKTREKMDAFVREYLQNGFNGFQAAIKAGYAEKSAGVAASYLLKKREVQSAIRKALMKKRLKAEVTEDRIIEELKGLAFSRMTDFMHVDEEGLPQVDLSLVDEDTGIGLSEFQSESETLLVGRTKKRKVLSQKVKIKLHDKGKALSELRKHFGYGVDAKFGNGPDDEDEGGSGNQPTIVIVGGLPEPE